MSPQFRPSEQSFGLLGLRPGRLQRGNRLGWENGRGLGEEALPHPSEDPIGLQKLVGVRGPLAPTQLDWRDFSSSLFRCGPHAREITKLQPKASAGGAAATLPRQETQSAGLPPPPRRAAKPLPLVCARPWRGGDWQGKESGRWAGPGPPTPFPFQLPFSQSSLENQELEKAQA